MIRFYKAISKILRTLKSYLTGAVLKIVLFSYNVHYVMFNRGARGKRGCVQIEIDRKTGDATVVDGSKRSKVPSVLQEELHKIARTFRQQQLQ